MTLRASAPARQIALADDFDDLPPDFAAAYHGLERKP